MTWLPTLGERVRLPRNGRTGIVVHVTLTEWGFLFDVELDRPAGEPGETERRTYATGEVAQLEAT